MTTLTKPTARAASTALAFEHASDLAASADNAIKRMCDIFAALFGIILLTPLWIIVAAMVRLNDGGPAFFTQERVGLDGKTFTMFKFRTMRVDAEDLKASLMKANEGAPPGGPAPTTTKVRSLPTRAGSVSISASSNAPKIRARSSSASSMVFMPGANTAKWSLPK